MEFDDEPKLSSEVAADIPTIFHLSTCPALNLGKCSEKKANEGDINDVYFLLEPKEDEVKVCSCRNLINVYDTIEKENARKHSYKAPSSTASFISEGEVSSIGPSEDFDNDEDYEISDTEKDYVTELDKVKVQVLKRFKLKDSYDQFCESNKTELSCSRIPNAENTEVDTYMGKSCINDDSSENSATESERRMQSKSIGSFNSNSGFFEIKSKSKVEECCSSSSDPDSIRFDSNYQYDYKHTRSSHHTCYFDENPSRISPLFIDAHNYPNQKKDLSQYFSDDNNTICYRTKQPPTYNQAIIDIERVCNRKEIANSEEMYNNLLRMEKQLGVQLGGSLESELNSSTLPSNYRVPHSKNSSDTGYISDVQTNSGRERYGNREKSVRCAQLLNEFKSSKPEDLQLLDNNFSPDNCSLHDMITNLPTITPILKRTNSNSSSSTHNEWLV